MENNGQLTFSDDSVLTAINEVHILIEEGNFNDALLKLNPLMDDNPDHPGLQHSYRTAKFWGNRKSDIRSLGRGKQTADFLMKEWNDFLVYSADNSMTGCAAYKSAMKYVFFTASENYKIAFQNQESAIDNFDLLLNLGKCFIILEEYKSAVETLEYARTSYKKNAGLLAMLGEAYHYINESAKSLLSFKEAFFINPSDVDMNNLKAEPILQLIQLVKEKKPDYKDIREWMPVFGFTEGIFHARKNLNSDQIDAIKHEIFTLEKNFQTLPKEKIESTNITPRLINKYLWMLDYFKYQNYDLESMREIKARLIQIDKKIFEEYFKKQQI